MGLESNELGFHVPRCPLYHSVDLRLTDCKKKRWDKQKRGAEAKTYKSSVHIQII